MTSRFNPASSAALTRRTIATFDRYTDAERAVDSPSQQQRLIGAMPDQRS
jgi:hypothetical protein